MSEDGSLDAAVKRLALALDALDAAVERRREGDQRERNLAEQLHALGHDRVRLAETLDGEAARIRALEDAQRDVVARIDVAMETIRTVIESNDR